MMKLRNISLLLVALSPMLPFTANASFTWGEDVTEESLSGASNLYNDSVDVVYLESVTINAQRNWVGVRVLKKGDTCFEVKQDIKVNNKKDPFGEYIGASALPTEIDVGRLDRKMQVVECSKYEVAPKTIKF